ncbi:hypothetical protein [Aromatoleum buckelii]|uniref:Uncharacterized protein n=1 Tax=Aromatoleum buckelii TaxID=200254 RepID=A0ABX1N3I7_9RHOO|nr:hypothetical protein [Aromatoleum buckelii]MCK0511770.1 hypothetical protein [Aromatoleum buckelii]
MSSVAPASAASAAGNLAQVATTSAPSADAARAGIESNDGTIETMHASGATRRNNPINLAGSFAVTRQSSTVTSGRTLKYSFSARLSASALATRSNSGEFSRKSSRRSQQRSRGAANMTRSGRPGKVC